MSRVAKSVISIPEKVELLFNKGSITVTGPNGSITQHCNHLVELKRSEDNPNHISFQPSSNDPNAWAQAGTIRALVYNMIQGVTTGFQKNLELVGVGYRAQAKPESIALSLGFSHPVEYQLPKGVTAETPNNTTIILKSIDKQLLGQAAAEIRSYRPPEPYKGKGIRYSGENISIKEAKKK